MTDLLVKLYELDKATSTDSSLIESGAEIRRALVAEKSLLSNWVRQTFGKGWANECEVSFSQQPVACFIAVLDKQPVGFACYNTTFKAFFGPIGVCPKTRARGIGKALLISGLDAMANQGYAYAVIGGAGPGEFFHRSVPSIDIPDSTPGPYRGMLK